MARFTRIDEDGICALVALFYDTAREDPLLAPVFEAAVGETDEAWIDHKARVAAFWASVMTGDRGYSGRPVQAHAFLPGLGPAHFRRWLELFALSCNELFPPHLAEEFMEKARRMANALQAGVALARGAADPSADLRGG